MPTPPRPRRVRPSAIAGLVGTLLLAAVGAAAQAQEAAPGEPNPPWDDGALPAEVDPGLANVRPATWEHVLVAPDGRTLTVYFWNGPPECTGLANVRVEPRGQQVSIQLRVGDVPEAGVCPAVAQLYRVVVVLDDRILTGGSLLDLPSG